MLRVEVEEVNNGFIIKDESFRSNHTTENRIYIANTVLELGSVVMDLAKPREVQPDVPA